MSLMGEIAWREGDGLPTSTRTFLVIVENDVNRGTEGVPVNGEPAYPPPSSIARLEDLEALPTASTLQRGFMSSRDKIKLDSYPGSDHSTLPLTARKDLSYPPLLSNGQTTGAQVSISGGNFMLAPFFVPAPTINGLTYNVSVYELIVRASGSGVPAGARLEIGIYLSEFGLPTERILHQVVVLAGGINANSTQTISLLLPYTFPQPGPYWFAILNAGSDILYLASAEPWTPLLGNLIGCGLNTTGTAPRALSGAVPSGSSLPTSLSTRLLDMRSTVATQSALRLRVSVPIFYISYNVLAHTR